MPETTPQTLHVSGYGKKLKKHKDLLVIEWKEKDGEKSLSLTPARLEHLILSGEHLISTGAMRLVLDNDISLSVLDAHGNPEGYLFSHEQSKHIDFWEKQLLLDPEKSVEIARNICVGAARNKIAVLLSLQKSRNVDLGAFTGQIMNTIDNMCVDDSSVLMGHEGRASNIYFDALRTLIPDDFQFNRRIKHPSPDPVNVMLSYGYGILYSRIRFALIKARLNPYHGVLHSTYRNQEALVYDLIEEFRQPVVDKTVLAMIGKKQVSPEDFSMNGGSCIMDDGFKKDFSVRVLSRLGSKTKYGDREMEFNDIIYKQAVELKNAIIDHNVYNAFEYKWW